MVIDETLRMFPPAIMTDRVANSDYESNGIKIPNGQTVTIAIWAVHYNPDIYPNPKVFNPERLINSHLNSISYKNLIFIVREIQILRRAKKEKGSFNFFTIWIGS